MAQSALTLLTITLNPALDMATATQTVRAGPKLRCSAPSLDPGGGGINVSRAILAMGGQSTALVALGGATGAQLADLLTAAGVKAQILPAPGETRQSLAVTEIATSAQFRFVMPGPIWDKEQVSTLTLAIQQAVPVGGIVVISGSQPKGFPDDFALRLAALSGDAAHFVLDTSGAPLAQIAAACNTRLSVLRMDEQEAEILVSHKLTSRAESADFAASLVAKGVAKTVIVARGADGTVMVCPTGRWFCKAADVQVVSKVGAGDSFVAGFVLGMARGLAPEHCLAHGTAAASAAVMTPATELCRAEDVTALIPACGLMPI